MRVAFRKVFVCALDIAHIARWIDAVRLHKELSASLLALVLQHAPTNHCQCEGGGAPTPVSYTSGQKLETRES